MNNQSAYYKKPFYSSCRVNLWVNRVNHFHICLNPPEAFLDFQEVIYKAH